MVRCDGDGRLRQQDDGGPQQDAGWDGGEGDHPAHQFAKALKSYSEGGDALPFHSDWYRRFCLPVHTGREAKLAECFSSSSQNWLLSLVLLTVVPAMAVMGGIIGKIMTAAAKDEMDIYGKVTRTLFRFFSGTKSPNKAHEAGCLL